MFNSDTAAARSPSSIVLVSPSVTAGWVAGRDVGKGTGSDVEVGGDVGVGDDVEVGSDVDVGDDVDVREGVDVGDDVDVSEGREVTVDSEIDVATDSGVDVRDGVASIVKGVESAATAG